MSSERDDYVSLATQCITFPTSLLVPVVKDEQLPKTEVQKIHEG